MKRKNILLGLFAIVFAGFAGYGLYSLGMQRGMGMAALPGIAIAPPKSDSTLTDPSSWTVAQGEAATRRHLRDGLKSGDIDPVTGRRILDYQDPMVPGKQFAAPGKSPFMDMMLVPRYAGPEGADTGHVTISPRIAQNIGLRTAPVVAGAMSLPVVAVGSVVYDERDQVIVQARATGYVERLFVRATLDRVAKGQALAELYVPDWIAAQEEFLAVRRMRGRDLDPLIDGARLRMRQSGMSDEQIALVESTGRTLTRITVHAPIGGVVTELLVREGTTVMPGATLFRINGVASVWVNAEVPESQAALVHPGTRVVARSSALPGATFEGRVQAIVPELNVQSRTLKARVELANASGRLLPGMFVQLAFADARTDSALMVPSEAVIATGRRTVVMLAEADGRFRPVAVEIGGDSDGQTEIRRGLVAGQRVVLSGQFLIDSEASLKGLEARLNSDAAPAEVHK